MPEDRVTITADANQYFDVLSRAGVAADRLGASGVRVGESFVRGERVVRRATQNITSSLLMAGDATSTLLVAASSLERVFSIGIGPTVAVAGGIKLFEVMHDQVKRLKDAVEDVKGELSKPLIPDPVTSDTDRRIEELTQKLKKMTDESSNFETRWTRAFLSLSGIAASLFLPQILKGPVLSGLKSAAPTGLSDLADLSKRGIDRLGQLADLRGKQILDAADKLHDALREAVQRFKSSTGNLFRDIGSGQFLKNLAQRNLENAQTQAGQDMVRQFEEDLANGIALGPNAQAMVNAAREAAARGGVGIQDILNADFSNLDMLSKYDFSGLQPLSGMTIIIQ